MRVFAFVCGRLVVVGINFDRETGAFAAHNYELLRRLNFACCKTEFTATSAHRLTVVKVGF